MGGKSLDTDSAMGTTPSVRFVGIVQVQRQGNMLKILVLTCQVVQADCFLGFFSFFFFFFFRFFFRFCKTRLRCVRQRRIRPSAIRSDQGVGTAGAARQLRRTSRHHHHHQQRHLPPTFTIANVHSSAFVKRHHKATPGIAALLPVQSGSCE
jgi:hypothetical protein